MFLSILPSDDDSLQRDLNQGQVAIAKKRRLPVIVGVNEIPYSRPTILPLSPRKSELKDITLYSTDHISIEYGIRYDGVDIRKLSPGTRGIVLLLLYLALDDQDDRPLIIDQPEENFDPKSVYDELVPLFQAAKRKRQVVIVTHNANLVVNADADQVIIAEVDAQTASGLPPITYLSGGLECDALP